MALAADWGVGQDVIGVFLVGAGTSLPELALAVGSARKGQSGLSVGHVIGSNTFDLLVPVGPSAVLHPRVVSRVAVGVDLPFLALATLAALVLFARHRRLERSEATFLLALYGAYAALRLGLEAVAPGDGP